MAGNKILTWILGHAMRYMVCHGLSCTHSVSESGPIRRQLRSLWSEQAAGQFKPWLSRQATSLHLVNEFEKNSQSLDIYNHSSNVKKAKSYLPMVPSKGAWSILTAIDKDMHRHKRNLSSRALSDKAVRDFEPAMIVYVDLFTKQLTENLDSSKWSSPKNMIDFCGFHHRSLRVTQGLTFNNRQETDYGYYG